MKQGRLRELRKERGLTLDALAELVGTSKQTVQRYETGIISNIPKERVEALAAALGVTPAGLMGWGDEDSAPAPFYYKNMARVSIKRLPVLGAIACGNPILATESHESFVTADGTLDADFCLYAQGDSMTGARIYDGDIVFIRSQSSVDNGEIAAVIINDEATLKRVYYYPEDGKLILSPENPRYAPLVYIGEELESIKIIGKAVAFQSRIY